MLRCEKIDDFIMQCGLILAVWALVCAQAALGQGGDTQAEMQKALEEFKVQSRELGLRADSPRKTTSGGGAGVRWHGRVYENFRNDFLDAVPHEITQGGGSKSLLRRNQFGFSLTGPLVIPKLYRGQGRTFLSVSYEGVRERTSRSFLDTVPTLARADREFLRGGGRGWGTAAGIRPRDDAAESGFSALSASQPRTTWSTCAIPFQKTGFPDKGWTGSPRRCWTTTRRPTRRSVLSTATTSFWWIRKPTTPTA